jgi:peptidoglycan/LPS O-acetylase OafA/YrhL
MRSGPLDGVRAVAVMGVLAYHAHYGWASGGYLGVDVFFVLSGYLITRVLLSTHRSWWGYRQFLVRRAVRLVPALVVAVVGMTVVGLLTGLSGSVVGRCGGASVGYVMNLPWVEQWTCPPMWHITWSLAAEQQFYLVWPLALALLASVLRRRYLRARRADTRRRVLLVAGSLAVALWVASVAFEALRLGHGTRTSRIAFAPDGRSLVLLLGCALALFAARRPRGWTRLSARTADGAAIVSGAVLLACFGWGGMTRGLPALVPLVVGGVAALLLVTTAAHAPAGSLVDVALGARPVAWLGRVSYSLYLWHEVAYTLAERVAPRGSPVAEVLRFTLALAFAAASYRWVEQPAQRWWSARRTKSEEEPARTLVSAS